MPKVNPTKENFDKSYEVPASAIWSAVNNTPLLAGEPPLFLHYNRYHKMGDSLHSAQAIVSALNIQDGDSVGLLGAGFGWIPERMAELLPISPLIAVDTSPWIQSEKGSDEVQDILDALDVAGIMDQDRRDFWVAELQDGGTRARIDIWDYDLTNGGDRNKLKQRIGGATYDFAITLDLLPWATDNEVGVLSTWMNDVANTIAHWVTPWMADQAAEYEPEPTYNWKTLADWKILLPNDTLIDRVVPHEVL